MYWITEERGRTIYTNRDDCARVGTPREVEVERRVLDCGIFGDVLCELVYDKTGIINCYMVGDRPQLTTKALNAIEEHLAIGAYAND